MTLEPREIFTIARQIGDSHIDSTTYYVRAVVRNARTDASLETVNLTDRGSGRFSNTYQVPADTSGLGFYISITTTVYIDSAYSNKSQNHLEEVNTYLVYRRRPIVGGGGGGLTEEQIRKIVRAELTEAVKEAKKIDFSGVLKAIQGIRIPEQATLDISPVFTQIQALADAVRAIPTKHQDLSPITGSMEGAYVDISKAIATVVPTLEKSVKFSSERVIDEARVQIKEAVEKFKKDIEATLKTISEKELTLSFGQVAGSPIKSPMKLPKGFRSLMRKHNE